MSGERGGGDVDRLSPLRAEASTDALLLMRGPWSVIAGASAVTFLWGQR